MTTSQQPVSKLRRCAAGCAWPRQSILQKAFAGAIEGLMYQTLAQTLPHYSLFAGDAGVLICPEGLAHQARATGADVEAVVAANLQRAVRLRQAILQRAFSGELAGHDVSCPSARQAPAEDEN